ncbi:hypothetical protein L9F63_005995 [Diploptera punctata]|uniref:Protein kinase domain-containing protein n=1 Tax=Diploptera punctata TaxID=6984 RepID=A0AAD8E5D9_DIPPU|nr:hypothetical protein L9F63_005995 [Diploptera punctata]
MMAEFPDCDVKLCDFEISRVILEGTEIREILGTPDYVAPEILHYEPITLKADMWSLGVTTYVLLTGFSPFGGETDQETFCNISKAEVDFPEELFEDVSEEAQDFIKRLLVRDPGARPTAKECLRHKWLSKKISRTSTPPSLLRQDSGLVVTKTTPRDDAAKHPTRNSTQQQQRNLRKYLSKSREALFERVIQQQQQHQKNSLRKTTLLSQYHKTRRLCESQMSLVSKSRERLFMMDQHQMSPYFSRSREKLYGLRSLSKSHEVLDLTKIAAANGGQTQEGVGLGILKTLTRATTADLSMIPLLRQKLLGHGSSTTSITSSLTTDQDLDDPVIPPSPSEQPKLNRMQSTSSNVVQSPIANTTIEEILEHLSDEAVSSVKPEPITPIPALLSPKLLKETLKNQTKFGLFSEDTEKETVVSDVNGSEKDLSDDAPTPTPEMPVEETIESESCADIHMKNDIELVKVKECTSSNETLIEQRLEKDSTDKDENRYEIQNGSNENVEMVEKINQKNTENIVSLQNISTDIPDRVETNFEESKDNELPEIENEDGDESPIEEPRYTVAQLVSAFNRHQEVISKSSLDITMSTNDKENKMTDSQRSTFPIGPNALRLFIPDIDITSEPPKRKQKRKYNIGIKYPNQNNGNEDVPKETSESLKEMYFTEDEESFQSLESTSSLTGDCDSLTNLSIPEDTGIEEESKPIIQGEEIQNEYITTDENIDSTNNNNYNNDTNASCPVVVEPVTTIDSNNTGKVQAKENSNKFQLSVDVIPNYLRSGSLSSEASVASSETSSTMSWEELTPPNTATPTTNKEEPQQWVQKTTSTLCPIPKQTSRSRSPSTNREPWGRLCTGTYNRAMEKFNCKVNKQEHNIPLDPNRRPNRKSLTLLSPPQITNPSEKVRRKSIPVIKQYS